MSQPLNGCSNFTLFGLVKSTWHNEAFFFLLRYVTSGAHNSGLATPTLGLAMSRRFYEPVYFQTRFVALFLRK